MIKIHFSQPMSADCHTRPRHQMAFVLRFPTQTDRERTGTCPLQKLSQVVLVCQNNDRWRSGSDYQINTLPYLSLNDSSDIISFSNQHLYKIFYCRVIQIQIGRIVVVLKSRKIKWPIHSNIFISPMACCLLSFLSLCDKAIFLLEYQLHYTYTSIFRRGTIDAMDYDYGVFL